MAMATLVAGVEAAAQVTSFKVYVARNPGYSLALVPSSNRLVLRPANPTDPYQQWEKRAVVSDNGSFELVNRGSGKTIMNVHILPPKLVETAYFHPRLLRATARWTEGVGVTGADGGVDLVCVSVLRNLYLPLTIVPWGQEQDNNIEMMGDQVVVVPAELEAEDYAGPAGPGVGAGEADAAARTSTG